MAAPERLDPPTMARVAAREFFDGAVVNLGVGLPLACADYLPASREVLLHSEQGLLGYGPIVEDPADLDPHVVLPGGHPVRPIPGMCFLSHEESFALIRGGHVDIAVLGGLQVDGQGNLASTHVPGKPAPGLGGAQDLAQCAKRTIVLMSHTTKDGAPKVLERCTMPLTAPACVDRVITDVAVLDIAAGRVILLEHAPGWSVDQIQAITGARLAVAEQLREISLA